MSPTRCIDNLEKWLRELGLGSVTERVSPTRLKVSLKTATKPPHRYKLYFEEIGDFIRFESIVFKSVSGQPERVKLFLEALLAFNGAVAWPSIAFSYVRIQPQKWRISLQGSQESRRFDKNFLCKVLDIYDEAYTNHIPQLQALADETVEFDEGSEFLDAWLRTNFPEDDL
jgi:hypothetical protein